MNNKFLVAKKAPIFLKDGSTIKRSETIQIGIGTPEIINIDPSAGSTIKERLARSINNGNGIKKARR